MSQTNEVRKIICASCAGVFDEDLPKCPYCGTLNIEGAEKEYFEKLEDVREDLEQLTDIPVEEVKTTLKKQTKLIKKVLIGTIIVCLALLALIQYVEKREERDAKAEYLWKLEHYPQMTEWYEQGEYDLLMDYFWEAVADDQPIWAWEHSDFCIIYDNIQSMQYRLELEQDGETLDLIALENMFYEEWCIIGMPFRKGLTEDDLQRLGSYIEIADRDIRERYALTEEEYNHFYELIKQADGYPDSKTCYEFVDSRMKDKGVE